MKSVKLLFLSLLFVGTLISINSCKKNEKEDPNPQEIETGIHSNLPVESDQSYTKKWQVSNTALLLKTAATTNEFYSFEFTPYGQYIVVDKDSIIHTGNYTYNSSNSTIALDNYGDITITSISATAINFTIYVNDSGESFTVVASSTNLIELVNDKTNQLARTWQLVSQKIDGEDTGILYNSNIFVIISKYGTHVLSFEGMSGEEHIPQVWKWSDDTQKQICVGDFVPDCNEPLDITIGSNNRMVVTYTDIDGTTVETYEAME